MSLTEATLARMNDASRVPTDEVSALIHKMLLQHCVEMEHLDDLLVRHEAGEDLSYEKEVAFVKEAQRQVHLEFSKRYPQFKYASQMSYGTNRDDGEGQPQFRAINTDGSDGDFAEEHDFNRDFVVNSALEQVFKRHTRVFEDGTWEFCWEIRENEHQVTFTMMPEEGQAIH